ncbi:nestin [Carlito syrichta]|uniref:Nestin n=1 Tax=Carlito syrichta TaxID=1868482 RepID=A0A3Q0E738_CARSF|nr:nestin [Carlito syrichta]
MEGCMGEESFQMWELNRRLEAYLARVKALEEQNEQLSAELGGLRAQSGDASWRARADDEISKPLTAPLAPDRELAVEALEQEKQGLQSQIAQVLEGRQQLAHLKMSLSLEVATYRTLLEAENSRLQTPGGASKAALGFQELQFLGTPEGRRLGPLLPVVSPTVLPSPLPATLETPVPAFLKSREFLQAHTPTLASTPIPPTSQAPCPATEAEIKGQDAPLSLFQTQGGRQQGPEPLWAEAKEAIPASVQPGPEEPGGTQQEASTGQSPEDAVSSAPPLSPDHSSLEAKDAEPRGSRVSSIFQEESEGQIWGPVEKETATEGKAVSSEQQKVWREEGVVNVKEAPDSWLPVDKETLESLGEKIQEPLKTGENLGHETLEKGNKESLQALGENLETQQSPEKESQELLKPLEEKDVEAMSPLEKATPELLMPTGKEDTQTLQSLENQEQVRSLEGHPETVSLPGKESQELVSSLEENLESLTTLEKEDQEPLKSQKAEDQKTLKPLTEENQESLRPLKDENQEDFSPLERENQEPLKSLEEEDQKIVRPPEKGNQESLGSLEEEDQEIDQETLRPLEKDTQQPLSSLGEEGQMTLRPTEKVDSEPLMSLGKENQEELKSLKEESMEAVRPLEADNLESLKSAEENLEILKSLETQEPLWSLEGMNQGTMKALEKEIQEPLGSVEENQATWRLLEKENQGPLRPLGAEGLEDRRSPEEGDKESPRNLEEEENLRNGENQESQEMPRSADGQGWEGVVVRDQGLGQDSPSGRAGVENEDEEEPALGEQDYFAGKAEVVEPGELQPSATGEAWTPDEGCLGSPEPKEQRGSAGGAGEKGGAESLQDQAGQPEQVGTPGLPAPGGMPELIEPLSEVEHAVPPGDQDFLEATLGSEPVVSECAVGAEQGEEPEVAGLEHPGHLAREQVTESLPGEESLEAERAQGLEGPEKGLEEAEPLEAALSQLPVGSRDPLEPPKGWEGPEPEAPWGAEEMLPAETSGCDGSEALQPQPLGSEDAEEGAPAVLGPPSPIPTPILEDAPGLQPHTQGSLETSWGLEGRAEALGKVEGEQEELGSGEIPEGLQEEGEESREESADELGETLPDSTPLGLYLRSPASLKWDPAGEQRTSLQGETGKEGWDPADLASGGLGAQPSEEEEEDEEEEGGRDSDLSEEFEDLGTEASLLPGVPGGVAEPLGQVPPLLLEPAAWDADEESDGFADEEESGEEGEEEDEEGREPRAGRWGPGSSLGSPQTPSSPRRGDLLESEAMGVSAPWDDGLRGAVPSAPRTALETESQDSAEPSGSEEESDSVSLEREDQGPLEGPSGAGGMGPAAGDTLGINGRGPNSEEESEHVTVGVMNGLEQCERGGQGKLGAPEGERGSPLQEEEGGVLKTPWAGAPLHLGPGQFLKFTQREGDRDSWSSGED